MRRYDWGRLTHAGTGGTGTLTLANLSGWPDPVQALGTSGAWLVPYVINEYSDSTKAVLLQSEKGIGTLTLAASIGSATLARTLVQETWASSAYNATSATAITVGNTAANVDIIIGQGALDIDVAPTAHYTGAGDNKGVFACAFSGAVSNANSVPTSGSAVFVPFTWRWNKVVTRAAIRLQAQAGSAGTSSLNLALFQVGTDGRPGKRICHFGDLGDMRTTAVGAFLTSADLSTPIRLPPGVYYMGFIGVYSGTAPTIRSAASGVLDPAQCSGLLGTSGGNAYNYATVASGDLNDPPTLTGWTGVTSSTGSFGFQLG